MEKPARYKAKNKKPTGKPKSAKKRKSSDGPTCSMFLAELTRKLASKKRQEEESSKNIVQTIIESITNALPIKFSRKSPPKKDSPMRIETLQSLAPELLPNNTLDIPAIAVDIQMAEVESLQPKPSFKMPKMPVATSEIFKAAIIENRRKTPTEDVAVNTSTDHDVASEIAKHVGTLRKISLIAEEFNQKTAKNLKEIVDSVQEDLIKKLEEIQAQQSTSKSAEYKRQIVEDESLDD